MGEKKKLIDDQLYEEILERFRQGKPILQIEKELGVGRAALHRFYKFGRAGNKNARAREPIYLTLQRETEIVRAVLSGNPDVTEKPNSTIMKMFETGAFVQKNLPEYNLIEEQKAYNESYSTASAKVENINVPDEEIPRHFQAVPPLWQRVGSDIKLDAKGIREALKDDSEAIVRDISDSMKEAIISQTTETIAAVEDRLDSIRYARAVKGMLAQQGPMVKKAIGVIGQIIDDLSEELPSLSTMQKVSVLQRVSGYIGAWQGSVEAAIRLERLLLGEPESHVAVSEMTQEDALKKLDRLRALAEQAKSRVVSDS